MGWVDCKTAEKSQQANQPKPGDWWCPQCGDLVFSTKTTCRMCGFDGAAKGLCKGGKGGKKGGGFTQRAGYWNCPNCGDLVFASKSACRQCGTPKPEGLT